MTIFKNIQNTIKEMSNVNQSMNQELETQNIILKTSNKNLKEINNLIKQTNIDKNIKNKIEDILKEETKKLKNKKKINKEFQLKMNEEIQSIYNKYNEDYDKINDYIFLLRDIIEENSNIDIDETGIVKEIAINNLFNDINFIVDNSEELINKKKPKKKINL